jgi:hypothetical protein
MPTPRIAPIRNATRRPTSGAKIDVSSSSSAPSAPPAAPSQYDRR